MSIRRKILVLNIVMVIVPIVLVIAFGIILFAMFSARFPDIAIALTKAGGNAEAISFFSGYVLLWSLLLAFITIVVAFSVTGYISRSILRPLKELAEAMEHIKDGDLNYEFIGSGDKEIQALCIAFEELRLRLKEAVDADIIRDREYKMLFANISHDLKTPITSIRGYVEGIRDGIADTPEKEKAFLKTVLKKTEVLEDMAENLSLYSKLELKKLPYDMKVRDIAEFLRETLSGFALDLEHSDMELVTNLPSAEIWVKIDREKMQRVFDNIISNAIKYKKEGKGSLTVSLEQAERRAVISFSDTGIGIAEKDREKVFEGFYRSDPSRNGSVEGNGLGLAIAKQIIEAHGGRIWLRSEEGVGTEFVIILPVAN